MEVGLRGMGLRLEDLTIAAVVHSTEAVLRCVQSGLGVSLTSFLAAKELKGRPELQIINPPGQSFQRAFYILRHRQRTLYPASERFIPLLRQETQRFQSVKPTTAGEVQ
jgi:DNA-binding transcriptional LysR family regulator